MPLLERTPDGGRILSFTVLIILGAVLLAGGLTTTLIVLSNNSSAPERSAPHREKATAAVTTAIPEAPTSPDVSVAANSLGSSGEGAPPEDHQARASKVSVREGEFSEMNDEEEAELEEEEAKQDAKEEKQREKEREERREEHEDAFNE